MKRHGKGRIVVLLILLAILCIGGVELAVCRVADPALYQQITAPVRQAVGALQNAVATLGSDLRTALAPEEPPEEQLAGEPAVQIDLPPTDPEITKLVARDNLSILTGGMVELVYFNQGESPRAEQYYGKDLIRDYGCGPTAMAMAVASLTGQQTDPAQMAQWARENGYWASKSGSYLSIVEGTAKAYGLSVESNPDLDADGLRRALSSGSIAVALMTTGHFTQRGHFILLRGATLTGEILVADPNSTERSLALWDAQLILDELSNSRGNGAPLWLLRS